MFEKEARLNACLLYDWITERHRIYQRRLEGKPPPWTTDPILQKYKFTNPFRENDRVTVWMRRNWTDLNHNRDHGEIIFNCCLFRMVGTIEFAEEHGWVTEWDPTRTKEIIERRLDKGLRTFTGAYIITNQGLKLRKSEVVVDHFLSPIWRDKEKLAIVASQTNSLQSLHNAMASYKGWGGGGFMSYEVVSDLNYTSVLPCPKDRFTWANAGPGAIRGLNRIGERPLNKTISQKQANEEMWFLLQYKREYGQLICSESDIDMRTIEHSLCEWDKYERVRLGEGKPRSLYKQTFTDSIKGKIE
tara:strand:+ start:3515 stop:4420 length:906 start_codon:yes stop_codon:yes gene_type:complete